MRRYIPAVAVVLLYLPQIGTAQTVTCTNCTEELPEVIRHATTIAKWLQQAEQMREQYQQLLYTVDSLRHINPGSLQTAMGLLNNASRLPGSTPDVLPGYNYGQTLSGAGQPFYNQNHYYTPQGNDWEAQEMQRREYATANLQGEAQTGIATIRQRLAGLDELQASIPEQPDVQATAAMNARMASEQAFLNNETNHIQNLAMLQQTQQAVSIQRAQQRGRQMDEEALAALKAAGGDN